VVRRLGVARGALSLARARLRIGKAVPGARCSRRAAYVPTGVALSRKIPRAIGAKASGLRPRARVRRKGVVPGARRRRGGDLSRSPRRTRARLPPYRSPPRRDCSTETRLGQFTTSATTDTMSGSTDTGYRVTRIERPVETAG
jgi:hypothetical protein